MSEASFLQPGVGDVVAFHALMTIRLIHGHRIDQSNEKTAQSQIETVLNENGIRFRREARLSARDIPDFLLEESGLAVEIKVRGARKPEIHRQLLRYAAHDIVNGLLLVSGVAMGLPPAVGGKPAYYASLGRGWV